MARPKKDESVRPTPTSITLNPKQKATLDKAAEELGLNRSALVCRIADLLEHGIVTTEQIALASLRMVQSRS